MANSPTTPTNNQLKHYFNSPTIPFSRPPSPIPRDDIIEGMSVSTASIFERDVEHFDSNLTAQEAIQLAVPSVLDEAFEALATVSPENILIDQIPLEYHFFNSGLSPKPIHSVHSSSPINSNQQPPLNINYSSPPAIPSSTPTPNHQNFTAYPFPLLNSPSQQSHITSYHHSPLSPSIPPALRHQTMSCTSDTASISDPSSPRSLSPTPSYKIGRSMVTQLNHPESIAILSNNNQHLISNEKNPLKNKQPIHIPSVSLTQSPQILTTNKPENEESRQLFPERKTCISFMSYVDVLNSERSDPSESVCPSSSAMDALRMARKSTSSLVKRASSIFSHSSRCRSSKKNNLRNSPTDTLGKAWVDRSRCNSSNTTYHSCPTQQSVIEPLHSPSVGIHIDEAEAEVLGEPDWK